MHHRYAIYFCPTPDSAWWNRGSQWLGRCAATQQLMQAPAIEGVPEPAFLQVTQDPRRYGWHATLKAPFTPATGLSESDLREAVQTLAQRFKAFDMPSLQVQNLGHFLALVPQHESAELQSIAAACVTELHRLAAPLSEAELARRRKSKLTPLEDALLVQWGYPYVLETFRFHCSLTGDLGALTGVQKQAIEMAARDWFADLPTLRFDQLALVAEPTSGADFVVLQQFSLVA